MKAHIIRKRRIWRNRTKASAKVALTYIHTIVREERIDLYVREIQRNLRIALAMNLRISADQFLEIAANFIESYDLSVDLLQQGVDNDDLV